MPRYFTHYWVIRHNEVLDGKLIDRTSGDRFKAKGIAPGDVVYIVSNVAGAMHLIGRVTVGCIASPRKAKQLLPAARLWDAPEHLVSRSATLARFDRIVPQTKVRALRFIGAGGQFKPVAYLAGTISLDPQTLRGLRELGPASAALLDELLQDEPVLASPAFPESEADEIVVPESPAGYTEGASTQVLTTSYERNPAARKACLARYGYSCIICGFNFTARYGEAAEGVIEVHHLTPISSIGRSYQIDPIEDLRPVCANCHTIIHRREPPYSIAEVKQMVWEMDVDRGRR